MAGGISTTTLWRRKREIKTNQKNFGQGGVLKKRGAGSYLRRKKHWGQQKKSQRFSKAGGTRGVRVRVREHEAITRRGKE